MPQGHGPGVARRSESAGATRRELLALLLASSAGGVAAVGLPRAAGAITVVPVSLEELGRRADLVVLATPRSRRSRWVGGDIVTDYAIEVRAVLRGSATAAASGAVLTLRLPGGTVGEVTESLPGVPTPSLDAPCLVFLSRLARERGVFVLAHMTAGLLPLATTPDGAVVADLAAVHGLVPAREAASAVRGVVPIDAVVATLRRTP